PHRQPPVPQRYLAPSHPSPARKVSRFSCPTIIPVAIRVNPDEEVVATIRLAGRVTAERREALRGKSGHRRAGRWGDPGGESRRKVAQKGDRRRGISRDLEGKGET